MPSKHQPPHPEHVKAALKIKHGPLTHLSRQWGFAPSLLSNLLAGRIRHMRLERRIAEDLETTPHALWPDRWSRDGEPLLRRTPKGEAAPAQRQIGEAA